MFDMLSERLAVTIKNIQGRKRLTEENIATTMQEVHSALLEADVALPVVYDFIAQVQKRAVGQEVQTSLNHGQAVLKIVKDELIALMAAENSDLNFKTQIPAVIMMAGLQGAGKTTTTCKLAKYLKEKENKKILLVSCDVYRPAAIKQLSTLAQQIEVECYEATTDDPIVIAKQALEYAKKQFFDVLLIDTAGRLHIDQKMMHEINQLHQLLTPIETLFTIDSMMGQDAVNAAKTFAENLALTGIILTKIDGDARGGVALSACHVTGKPVKFIGTGEKLHEFGTFHPDRIASRILGMGDVFGLIEEIEETSDRKKAEKLAKKLKKGSRFSLLDFRDQLQQMRSMGGVANIMEKLPTSMMNGNIPKKINTEASNAQFIKQESIINSMTKTERKRPEVINGSRKKRIATGSGTQIQDVNRLLKQFKQAQKMMKKMSGKGGMKKMLQNFGGGMNGLPFK